MHKEILYIKGIVLNAIVLIVAKKLLSEKHWLVVFYLKSSITSNERK